MAEARPLNADERQRRRRALSLLSALGRTALECSRSLARRGVKGRRDTANACPLAVHLGNELGGDWMAGGRVFYCKEWPDDPSSATPLPAACAELERRFDAGEFPALEESDDT